MVKKEKVVKTSLPKTASEPEEQIDPALTPKSTKDTVHISRKTGYTGFVKPTETTVKKAKVSPTVNKSMLQMVINEFPAPLTAPTQREYGEKFNPQYKAALAKLKRLAEA